MSKGVPGKRAIAGLAALLALAIAAPTSSAGLDGPHGSAGQAQRNDPTAAPARSNSAKAPAGAWR